MIGTLTLRQEIQQLHTKRALTIRFRGDPYALRDLPELTGMGTKGVEREGVQVGDRLSGGLKDSSYVLKE